MPKGDEMTDSDEAPDWKTNGVKVVPGDQLDLNTAQTPGMDRAAAINLARAGAQKLWAGTVKIHANAKTGAHHHGRARKRDLSCCAAAPACAGANSLEFTAEAGPGDFIFVPPYVPHQEINASSDEPLECVLVRSDNEAVVVNLDIAPARAARERALDRPDPSSRLRMRNGDAAACACDQIHRVKLGSRSRHHPRSLPHRPEL